MKESFTRSMAWLHTWGGLAAGWLLFVILFTGTLSLFHDDIGLWMQPKKPIVTGVTPDEAYDAAGLWLARHAPRADGWTIIPDPSGAMALSWHRGDDHGAALLDPATEQTVQSRETAGGHFLVEMHFSLHSGTFGLWLVAASGLFMLAAIISGIVIHKRIFRDFFTLRLGKGQRSWLDAHNVASVTSLPFQIMIALTGVLIFPTQFITAGIDSLYDGDRQAYIADYYAPYHRPAAGTDGAMLPLSRLLAQGVGALGEAPDVVTVDHPGDAQAVVTMHGVSHDRLSRMDHWAAIDAQTGAVLGKQAGYSPMVTASGVMVGLHFAEFGGAAILFLYLLGGLGSCIMVATGLILFGVKRAARHGEAPGAARRAIHVLNIAMIAGPMLATIAYLWANRLLPAALEGRAEWEVWVFFLAWLASLAHATLRSARRGWIEQIGAMAFACLLLPLIGLAATGEWLPSFAAGGDWARSGVEAGAVFAGLILLAVLVQLTRQGAVNRRDQGRRRAATKS